MRSIQETPYPPPEPRKDDFEAANVKETKSVTLAVSSEERKFLEHRFLNQIVQSIKKHISEEARELKNTSMEKTPMKKLMTTLPSFKPSMTAVLQTAPSGPHRKPGIRRGAKIPTGEGINHLMILKESEKTPLFQNSRDFRSNRKKQEYHKDRLLIQGDCSGDKLVMGDVEGKTNRLSREEIRKLRRRNDVYHQKVKVNENQMVATGEVILCYKIEEVSAGSIFRCWFWGKMRSVRRWFTLD